MSITKSKAFRETNQWVVALLIAGTIGVGVMALHFIPILGWGKASAMLWTVLGIFLTAIALQTESKNWMGALALGGILIASYAYLDGLSSEQIVCPTAEVNQGQ